jgi:hypothetical protein
LHQDVPFGPLPARKKSNQTADFYRHFYPAGQEQSVEIKQEIEKLTEN